MPELTAIDHHRRAQTALADSPVYALRELTVEQAPDGLLIHGCVSSFYHKQLAQEVVRAVAGPLEVTNLVEVQ